MATAVDINTASVGELTQLPGIAKNIAYNMVNHRKRHGWFTAWEELKEVKGFPMARLAEIKQRATLSCPDVEGSCKPPRHVETTHLAKIRRRPAGYTRTLRATTKLDRQRTGPRH